MCRYHSVVVSILVLLPIVLIVAFVPLTELLAARGSILEFQKEEGRLVVLKEAMQSMFDGPFFYQFFGKGFGYGTNTAIIFAENSPGLEIFYTDNSFLTFFLQFGLLGSIIVALLSIIFSHYILSTRKLSLASKILIFYFSIFLVIVSLTQVIFENHSFLPLFGLALSMLIYQNYFNLRPPPVVS